MKIPSINLDFRTDAIINGGEIRGLSIRTVTDTFDVWPKVTTYGKGGVISKDKFGKDFDLNLGKTFKILNSIKIFNSLPTFLTSTNKNPFTAYARRGAEFDIAYDGVIGFTNLFNSNFFYTNKFTQLQKTIFPSSCLIEDTNENPEWNGTLSVDPTGQAFATFRPTDTNRETTTTNGSFSILYEGNYYNEIGSRLNLVGGNLAPEETCYEQWSMGLYKNQDGSTMFMSRDSISSRSYINNPSNSSNKTTWWQRIPCGIPKPFVFYEFQTALPVIRQNISNLIRQDNVSTSRFEFIDIKHLPSFVDIDLLDNDIGYY
jgi:hypothetical protein